MSPKSRAIPGERAAAAAAAATSAAEAADAKMMARGRRRLSSGCSIGIGGASIQRRRRCSAPASWTVGANEIPPTAGFVGEDSSGASQAQRLSIGDHSEIAESSSSVHSIDDHDFVDEDPFLDLDQLLKERWVADDPESFAIFEDEDEELSYHKRRSILLARFVDAFRAIRDDNVRLREAGESLLDDLERLQQDNRHAIGESVYWRTLAEEAGVTVATLDS